MLEADHGVVAMGRTGIFLERDGGGGGYELET